MRAFAKRGVRRQIRFRIWGLTLLIATIALVGGAPAGAADPNKVLRTVFPVAETGFDPAGVQDLYSATIEQMLFETLLTYDYLARPAKL
ncbi:MAG TPA: hypothetical protein VGL43_01690, partial [Casimicrobiaceae bacterium]